MKHKTRTVTFDAKDTNLGVNFEIYAGALQSHFSVETYLRLCPTYIAVL